MPEKSGFFDTLADDPREYPAREFAEYFSRFIGNGVFDGGEKLKVTATGNDANVSIHTGYGWINGYMYSVYDEPLVLSIKPETTEDRIDRIILRLDVSTPVRSIEAFVLEGDSGEPVPDIARQGDIYDLSLAQVLVKANTTTIQPHHVTDERLNNELCGIVTSLINQADTTSIFNEFQSWLKTKTDEYQKQWHDFIRDIQGEGFTTTKQVKEMLMEHSPPHATVSEAGIVQLSDLISSTSTTQAATANAVKKAYDRAEQAFTQVSNGKREIASAITDKGVFANGSEAFQHLATKIRSIKTGYNVGDIVDIEAIKLTLEEVCRYDGNNLAIDRQGYLYFNTGNTIIKISPENKEMWRFQKGNTNVPKKMVVDKDGNVYYVNSDKSFRKISKNGEFVSEYSAHNFHQITDIAVDEQGYVYVMTVYKHLYKISPENKCVWNRSYSFNSGCMNYKVTLYGQDIAYIYSGGDFLKIDLNTGKSSSIDSYVKSVAIDRHGNVYTGNSDNTVRKINSDFEEVWKYTHRGAVTAVAVDKHSNVYCGDSDGTVNKISPDKNIVWGNKNHTFEIKNIIVSERGDVYIESSDNIVRKIIQAYKIIK